MLTKLIIRNFKGLTNAEIELGNPVVFVGPNDSGKTSALQALTLWELGLRRWTEKRGDSAPALRPGVAVNRRDLVGVPVPSARQIWNELRVRQTYRNDTGQRTENVRIDVIVEGITGEEPWSCGLEFDYNNEENLYCRPLRTTPDGRERMPVIPVKLWPRVALLGPMSGLASHETRLEPGAINVRLGEGRTAEVLRNLCLGVTELSDGKARWDSLSQRLAELFNANLNFPRLIPERGEVELTYSSPAGSLLDLSTAGRGMQQTLLLLSFIHLHPGSVLLLDEPDAHLEILRQRQIYEMLCETAADNEAQIICASHSEVILNESAANSDVVVAFIGQPHRIDNKSQVLKSLRDISFDHYYQAEITGIVLYLEGTTDLAMLRAFAKVLNHDAVGVLERPFVHYVGDRPSDARAHFYGLRAAKSDLVGYALFDHLDQDLKSDPKLVEHMWPRREIENYLHPLKTLRQYARREGRTSAAGPGALFEGPEADRWLKSMDQAVKDRVPPIALRYLDDPYWINTKISNEMLKPVFESFFNELKLPNRMLKRDYHRLVGYLEPSQIHQDVIDVLDSIVAQAAIARAAPTT